VLRIRDVYPGSENSKKEKGGKNVWSYLFVAKYHKIKNYFIFEQVKKKLWANLIRTIELFTRIRSATLVLAMENLTSCLIIPRPLYPEFDLAREREQ
jgi:hypothetical protein